MTNQKPVVEYTDLIANEAIVGHTCLLTPHNHPKKQLNHHRCITSRIIAVDTIEGIPVKIETYNTIYVPKKHET